MQLILGSQSPRRRELMEGLGLPFQAISIDADESFPSNLQAGDIPIYISRAKAHAHANKLLADQVLITADTIVWCEGEMLGKPVDMADAAHMLRKLSNNTHQVYTAVTLATKQGVIDSFVEKTDVTFRFITDSEIDYYLANAKPLDKAGAYGIQEWIGFVACTSLNGSYFNVMGFPVHRLYQVLKERGIV